MEKLIIVRHGDYDKDSGHLSDKGSADIKGVAVRIKALVRDSSALILSSPAFKAAESALILSDVLNVAIVMHDDLFSECQGDMNLDRALAFVRGKSDQADVLIVVTHIEYTDYLPAHFFKKEWDMKAPYMHLEKGEGAVIDYASKSLTKVA